jgi:ABC-type phosphate transport system substrate-binding protein
MLATPAFAAGLRETIRPPLQIDFGKRKAPCSAQGQLEGSALSGPYGGNVLDVGTTGQAADSLDTSRTLTQFCAIPDPGTSFGRDESPEYGALGPQKGTYQFIYAAVDTAAAQFDFVQQRSGAAKVAAGIPPLVADAFARYRNGEPIGFSPWAGNAPSTILSDSLHWASGDAPLPLGPPESAAAVPPGFTIYPASYAAYDNGGSTAGADQSGAGYDPARGPAIVVPLVGTGISIVVNDTNLHVPPSGLALTQNDVCGIFTGSYTNWNQTSSNPGNQKITIVHRADSAGTTFLTAYDLSQMCSAANPYAGAGHPSSANFWGGPNRPAASQGVGTESHDLPFPGQPFPTDGNAPEVLWPATSIGATGAAGMINDVGKIPGAVGYASPPDIPGLSADASEANVQNYVGAFEKANSTTVSASLASKTVSQNAPPGYPLAAPGEQLYAPFPTAAGGAPFVGFVYAYFYTCNAARLSEQVAGYKAIVNFITSSATANVANPIAAFWQLGVLGSSTKASVAAAVGNSHAEKSGKGTYLSPVDGTKKSYACAPI